MINKKLIHFNAYSAFEDSRSLLYDWSIAFIAETKQIYTHGNFYDCNIENINELNDKIDEILSDIYIETEVEVEVDVPNGIYIQATDRSLYTESEWDGSKTPNGIAVVTDNCKFVVALLDAHSSDCMWGGRGTVVSDITTTTDEDVAVTDYNGEENTTTIINTLNGTNDGYADGAPAAEYCRAFTFPNGDIGYLGAAGEWRTAMNNIANITSALNKCGGSVMNNEYWTSTQFGPYNSWYTDFDNDWLNIEYGKNDKFYVRAFTTLLNTTITSKISLKDKLTQLEQSIPTKLSDFFNFYEGSNTATSLSNIPVDKRLCVCTVSASGSLSLASIPSAGREIHIMIHNTSSSEIAVTLPNSGSYVNTQDTVMSIDANSYGEINLISDGSIVYIKYI